MKECIVVVPIYKSEFSHDEEMCVKKFADVLNGEDMVFVGPESIEKKYYEDTFSSFSFKLFSDKYFKNINGYNRLMLSEDFYKAFSGYEYMLIAQPDAVIWREENMIPYFIKMGFDYYGAPWIPERRIWEWTVVRDENGRKPRVRCAKKKGQGITMGNGGFSLRKIGPCISLIHEHRWRKIYWFLKRNEDIFFGLFGRKGNNRCSFKPADIETGKEFALEYDLKEYVQKGCIPFGVHGWSKYFSSFEEMEDYLKRSGIWK